MESGRRFLACLRLASLCFLLFSCAEPEFQLDPPSPFISFDELKQRVTRIRALPLLSDISLEAIEMESIQALLEKSLWEEHEKENLQQLAQAYTRLGLLAEATDLPKAILELRLFHHGAVYDSRRKTILLPQGYLTSGLPLLSFPGMSEETTRQIVLIHSLSHVLQERYFHWQEKIKNSHTEDQGLALRALAEGDSVLLGLVYLMGDLKESKEKMIAGVKSLPRIQAEMDKKLQYLPELLRQKAAFQYLQGSQFALWGYSLKGWEGVNALFSDPPLSSAQILHPEKYFVKRDNPVRITPWGLIRQFSGKKIVDDTIGEWLIQTLLGRTLSREEASRAAAGWAGDSLLSFQQGKNLVVGWITDWDNREEALEFFSSYRRALEKRYDISLVSAAPGTDTLLAPRPSGRSILLQIRDHFVFFLDGVPAPRSLEIAEATWNELETGAEPAPLELAKEAAQSPLVRR